MSTILPQLTTPLAAGQQLPPATVQIKLNTPLPAAPAVPLSSSGTPVPANVALTLTVVSTQPGGQTILQLPGGSQISAQVLPPPAPGSQITIPAAAAQILKAATPNTPLPTLTARIQPALPSNIPLPASNPATPSPASSVLPGQSAPPLLLNTAANNPTPPPENLPSTITNPGTSLTTQLINAINNLNISNETSNAQNNIPEGPVNISFRQQIASTSLQTPVTLTLGSPTGGQLLTPGQPPQLVTLAAPSTLPLRTPLPLTLLPNPNNTGQPVVLLTQPVPLTSAPAIPSTPPLLSALKVLLSGNQPAAVPVNTPIAARVLPQPIPGQHFQGQALQLASGHVAVLQSPQPIPAESTLVVEFPTVTGPAQVTRVQQPGQPAGQPQPQGQTAAPIATQTSQPVLPPGTVVQGTLADLNPQGQPQLTISQPSQYAGQTIPLTLPDDLHNQVPAGTLLSVRIQQPGVPATLLSITLSPSVQRAHTLTTLGVQWPTLQQALNVLSSQAPAVAQSLKSSLPQLSALMPGLMAFTEALRKNDPDSAFGKEATTLLRAMGVNLGADISRLSQLQQQQPDNAWRGTLFPYVENQNDNPHQGGFFWRREKKDDPRAATSTRFIMQLSLSQMGDVQLDGLVNYPEVWLKLRRHTPAEGGFVEGLQTLVNATLEAHGLSGGIAVEVSQTFPINPLAEMLAGTPAPLPTSA